MANLIPAAAYVRCSTDMQDESIDQQKRAIEQWASLNGYRIKIWFEDEGKSGVSFRNRPAFTRMISHVEKHPEFKCILVYDESRWGRASNPRESTYWKVHCELLGVKVRIINSQSRNDNDIGSYVVEVVESAEASEYSKKLSRSTFRGCVARVSHGSSCGGSAPYGYKRIAVDPISGRLIRDLPQGVYRRKGEEVVKLDLGNDSEVATVRRIFQLRLSGLGPKSIVSLLNGENIKCPQRGRWNNRDQKWAPGTVSSILENPVYYGAKVYNRFPKNKLAGLPRGKRNPASEWVIVENAHPAIVSKDEFQRAQQQRVFRVAAVANRGIASPYILTGLVRCSHCGFNYHGCKRIAKELSYYVDSGYVNKGKSVCEWHAIPKEKFESKVIDLVQERLIDSRIPRRLEELIAQQLKSSPLRTESRLKIIENQLRDVGARIQNLLRMIELGEGSNAIAARIRQLESEKESLLNERIRLESTAIGSTQIKNAAREAAAFILDFRKKFESSPSIEQKVMIRKVVQALIVDRKKDLITCRFYRIPQISNALISGLYQPKTSLQDCARNRT